MSNILVCDDDKEIVDAIEIYLKNEGYRIFKAYDGEEAIRILHKEDIQLFLAAAADLIQHNIRDIHFIASLSEQLPQFQRIFHFSGVSS